MVVPSVNLHSEILGEAEVTNTTTTTTICFVPNLLDNKRNPVCTAAILISKEYERFKLEGR
jgi:hypothetical protein